MKDTGLRKKVVSQLFDPAPGHPILLAPTSQRAAPEIGDAMPECVQCATIGRHRAVCRLMHSPLHLGVDVDRYSFIVSDLHRLLVAGLPAHCERFCTSSHTFIRREIRAIEDTPPVKATLPM